MPQWNYANSIIYNPILALIKASFLLTLIKLRSQNRWINHCLWATLGLNACFAIGAPLACILQCNPIAKYWDARIAGSCIHAGAYTVSTSSIVLGTDILILIMPSWILHDLKMPLGRKLMVIAFLSFGIAVTIVGAVRTSVLVKVFVIQEVVPDPTYSMSYILSNIESALAIIGTCGPTIKYILGFCFPSLKVADESNNRNYLYPDTGDSQRRSRFTTKAMHSHISSKEVPEVPPRKRHWSHPAQSCDDIEMTNAITKTVTWHIDGAHAGSRSSNDQQISTPRNML
jgi:hypothetical protein